MKLFPKLALTISALLLGITLGLTSGFYWIERASIQAQAAQERQSIVRQFSQIVREAFLANDDLLVIKYVGWLLQWNPSIMSAGVIGPSGETMAHSEPERIGKPWLETPGSVMALVQREAVKVGAHPVATVSVSFSQAYYDDLMRSRLRHLRLRITEIAGAFLLAGLLISLLLASSWTRPIAALVDAAGHIGRGRYAIDLSATDRRRDEIGYLSRAFLTMAEQLRQLEILKEDFVSAVTHELRSPLGAIESYLHLISAELADGISPETWRLYLDRLRLNTQRLARFVNDLLDVAALERGKVELHPQSTDLASLAGDVLQFFAPRLSEKKLTSALEASPDLPRAWADGDKIRQVLINLVSNAIKFTPEEGRISIILREHVAKGRVDIVVADTGIGIANEDQRKIFNKFEQVAAARRTVKGPKGTGLGLAVCKSLVELHGSRLEVDSRPGEGSRFSFALSLATSSRSLEGVPS